MEKVRKIWEKVNTNRKYIIPLVSLVVAFIRWLFCRNMQCALGWFVWSMVILSVVFAIVEVIAKKVKSRSAPADDKKEKEEETKKQ